MKKFATLMTVLLAAVVATPAYSQDKPVPLGELTFASDSLTVPVMINLPGLAGATFATYAAIMNPTSKSFPVQVTLFDAVGAKTQRSITLAPGELKQYTNFLDTVFGLAGAGTVRFQSGREVGGSTDNLFILSAEIYTTGSGVRYGTSLPTVEFPGTDSRSFSVGITVDANNRANVGCFNESTKANTILATVFDGTGAQVTTVPIQLLPNAWGQRAVNAAVTGGYVRFDPSAPASCYAVVANNGTNDARFIAAVEFTP
ncbi:MAG TPA: hypothetical protein VKH43_06100 [Thermoanaerobaculia bacterium]|nr:hypothetical protein [Thermoanaerobaculia bacterium]